MSFSVAFFVTAPRGVDYFGSALFFITLKIGRTITRIFEAEGENARLVAGKVFC